MGFKEKDVLCNVEYFQALDAVWYCSWCDLFTLYASS